MTESQNIFFGDCEIDVAAFTLRRADAICEVEPQVLELLLYLASNPDRLVTKDDLIRHVWHGRIVSDTTITSRIKSARQAIGDDGTQQKYIRTVHGRGVRFIAPVSVAQVVTPPNAANGTPARGGEAAAAETPVRRNWPAIAVLPFANLSEDRGQDYFADGVTEDIITDLSRFRELRVVARDSCFQHRSPGTDLTRIGHALKADYIVTGSIRRRGAKLRLSAQLTSVDSGNQVWAERFDRGAEDLFAMADELVRTIVGTLVGRVRSTGSALARRKAPANLAAYDCVLRGQAAQAHIGEEAEEGAARRFFEQALELDPNYPRAHAGLATVLLYEWFGQADDARETLEQALEHAERAVAIDGDDYECQEALGWILLHCKSYELSERHYHRSIALNPNSPAELAAMGSACRRRHPVVRAGAARRSLFRGHLVLEPAGDRLFQCAALRRCREGAGACPKSAKLGQGLCRRQSCPGRPHRSGAQDRRDACEGGAAIFCRVGGAQGAVQEPGGPRASRGRPQNGGAIDAGCRRQGRRGRTPLLSDRPLTLRPWGAWPADLPRHVVTLHHPDLLEFSTGSPSIDRACCVWSAPPSGRGGIDEEEIVSHRKSLLIVMVALSTVVLAGFVSVSLKPDTAVTYPNDRANHYSKHLNG